MRRSSWAGPCVTAVLCSVLFAACSDQAPTEPSVAPSPIARPTYAAATGPGGESRVLVQFKGTEGKDFEQRVKVLGGKVVRRNAQIGTALVSGLSPAAVSALRSRTDIEELGKDLKAQFIPSRQQLIKSLVRIPASALANRNNQSGAFFYDVYQWNIRRTKANQAWTRTRAGQGALVCDLNTGIDPRHIDLKGKVDLKRSRSFVESEPFIRDLHFHGTYVASIITTNGLGVASVAPAARICAIKVLDQSGSGSFADVLAGIVYAGAVGGVDVINLSLGALLDLNDPDQRALAHALQRGVNFARRKGVLVVASSGNDALNLDQTGRIKSIPAQLDNVVSVGATGPINQRLFDRLASYSNYGNTGNDLVAPGGENLPVTLDRFVLQDLIVGACSEFVPGCEGGDFFAWADGTSAAAPHVAAAAAVVESNFAGDQDAATLERCVLAGADNVGPGVFFGAGRLNVLRAAACS